ncbi:hypothetical protein GF339_19670 [candidate division KSB3 bacterium]|uniref:Uncharacterized protein n=1 Tax=candidate division KSB3 bacterium TaxID=2044937 RepID=A0A9D5JYZ9_9BACT|nr:hypothetical protein [candidate division KSB3 bacterium]MBD3326813.1 hypothetical protein [candidate division KSB3 bacterium]
MMQKTNLKYQASVFLDADSITPNMKDVTGLIQVLNDRALLPFITQEKSSARMGFRSIGGKTQVQLLLLSKRFIYERIVSPPSEPDIGDIETFCKEATQKLRGVLSYFERKCYRLALVQEVVLFDLSAEDLEQTTTRLLKLPPTYANNPPFEWDWRVTSAIKRTFGNCEETLNTITVINKRMGTIVKTENSANSEEENFFEEQIWDSLKVTFDINSSHENSIVRFGDEEIAAFFKEAPDWHENLGNEIFNFMFKEV